MYKKIMALVILNIFAFITFLVSPDATFANIVKNASGKLVNHYHFGYCVNNLCPQPDKTFETKYGFLSWNKKYSGTAQWNCHGRTFDNKQSWIDYAEPFIYGDWAGYSPATPKPGDVVIFYKNGLSTHTVTIVGTWKGLNTQVMSKYGMQGQYQHKLSDVAKVYSDSWWTPVHFGVTKVYTTLNKISPTLARGAKLIASLAAPKSFSFSNMTVEQLMEQRKQMPWYKDVLESEKLASVEYKKQLADISNMTEENKNAYNKSVTDSAKIKILIKDINDNHHYEWFGLYNGPEFTTDYVDAIEAGNLLAEMFKERPSTKQQVIDELRSVINTPDDLTRPNTYTDQKRGAAINFLGKILDASARVNLRQEILKTVPAELITPIEFKGGGMQTYTQFYINKL